MSLRSDRERFQGVFRVAEELIKELELDFYSENPENLTLNEALFLVSKRHDLGSGIPDKYVGAPWRIPPTPTTSTPEGVADKVNWLLNLSMKVQMGTIPGTEFSRNIFTTGCLAISGFLHLYLRDMGIASQLQVGVLKFGTRPGVDGTPHVWLKVLGSLVDNAFVYFPEESGAKQEVMFEMKGVELFSDEDPTTTTRQLHHGARVTSGNNAKMFKVYATPTHVEKFLVSGLTMVKVNPTMRLYDAIMRRYIRTEMGVTVTDVESKWKERCWGGGERRGGGSTCCQTSLKNCSVCKHAKYCSPECQRADWSTHKLLHKEMEEATLSAIAAQQHN